MADIPSSIPQQLRAGDTVRWRRELSDYPADDGWILKYKLVGPTTAYSVTAEADGSAYAITIPATDSAAYVAGSYRAQEYVEKGGERYTLSAVNLQVLPDLTTASSGYRTHARKMLDAIEAWLERKAPTAAAVEIAGRKLQNYPLADLLALRDKYRAEIRAEQSGGSAVGGRALVRF